MNYFGFGSFRRLALSGIFGLWSGSEPKPKPMESTEGMLRGLFLEIPKGRRLTPDEIKTRHQPLRESFKLTFGEQRELEVAKSFFYSRCGPFTGAFDPPAHILIMHVLMLQALGAPQYLQRDALEALKWEIKDQMDKNVEKTNLFMTKNRFTLHGFIGSVEHHINQTSEELLHTRLLTLRMLAGAIQSGPISPHKNPGRSNPADPLHPPVL